MYRVAGGLESSTFGRTLLFIPGGSDMRGESTSQIRGAGEWGWLNSRTISIEYNGFGRIRYMCFSRSYGCR